MTKHRSESSLLSLYRPEIVQIIKKTQTHTYTNSQAETGYVMWKEKGDLKIDCRRHSGLLNA